MSAEPPTVAALYVETGGVYFGLPDVEPWDEARDARLYAGPWPVVAHPPCNRWCKPLAFLNEARYGHKVGDDGGTFAHALETVRRFGGVLEHPAYSAAWDRFGLPRPARYGWAQSIDDPGFATEVDQHSYGHPCQKTTWLYYIGPNPPSLRWQYAPNGLPVISLLYGSPKLRATGRQVIRHAEASRTPEAFRDVLLGMARTAALTPA